MSSKSQTSYLLPTFPNCTLSTLWEILPESSEDYSTRLQHPKPPKNLWGTFLFSTLNWCFYRWNLIGRSHLSMRLTTDTYHCIIRYRSIYDVTIHAFGGNVDLHRVEVGGRTTTGRNSTSACLSLMYYLLISTNTFIIP